ncbi:hypothetical protein EXN66_Car016336 [Channa argus]|uniref:Uncharacterized protein n=1 Tax=Channa argus TaxID=215402 RepID=A0A6G1QE19_CHAAH|nr:hypothetical protein EXN66_Car016336 [Channa argus]
MINMMGNLKTCVSPREKTNCRKRAFKEMERDMEAIHLMFPSPRVKRCVLMMKRTTFIRFAAENCQDEAARQWLRGNSESFFQLADMFLFLKKLMDEEEKKNHSNNIHIIFVARGSISDSMIPASCLLPLSNITDVVLDSPWICCSSLKETGHQMIPNILLSPLQPPKDVSCSLTKTHGSPGRNRIIIPFVLPGDARQNVPFCVVTLALSLVLLNSRFKATVHLTAETKLEGNYVQQLTDDTDKFSGNWRKLLKHLMVKHSAHVCL